MKRFTEVVHVEHEPEPMLHEGAYRNFCSICNKPLTLRNGIWTHDAE